MATAHDLLDEPRFQTEWRRFDLLVQVGDSATAVEFKYYVLRRTLGLRGEFLGYKGGAGPKNEEEFRDCVHKLRAQRLRTIHGGDLGPVRDDVLAADLLTYGVPWPRVGKPPRRSGYVRTQ